MNVVRAAWRRRDPSRRSACYWQQAVLASRRASTDHPAELETRPHAAGDRQTGRAGQARTAEAPARPKPGWTVFDAAFEVDRDATIDAKMTNARRMLVKTDNIRRLRIDLNNLPGGSDARGPWNLQIDGQGLN